MQESSEINFGHWSFQQGENENVCKFSRTLAQINCTFSFKFKKNEGFVLCMSYKKDKEETFNKEKIINKNLEINLLSLSNTISAYQFKADLFEKITNNNSIDKYFGGKEMNPQIFEELEPIVIFPWFFIIIGVVLLFVVILVLVNYANSDEVN